MNLYAYRAWYFMREALVNARYSPVLTLVSVLTIAVSLMLVGLFGYILLNGYQVLDRVGEQMQLVVYFEDEVSPAVVESVAKQIGERPDVAKVMVLDANADRDRNLLLLDDDLISGLDPTSIPGSPSIDIELSHTTRTRDDLDKLTGWLQELEGIAGVEDIHFSAETYRVIYSLVDIVQLVGLLIGVVILFAAVFFVFGTIKLAVFARKDEIEVLRLVGATRSFIRTPFYIEGVLQGLSGGIVALIALGVVHLRVRHYVEVEQALNTDANLLPLWMVLWLLGGGMLLGLMGSAFSVGRHLRT